MHTVESVATAFIKPDLGFLGAMPARATGNFKEKTC